MMPGSLSQGIQIENGFVGQGVCFQVVPNIFDGIELGRIRREELRAQPFFLCDIALDDPSPMGQEAIPEEDERAANVPAEIFEER